MKQRILIWLGMAFSAVVVLVIIYFVWAGLLNREARSYGANLTHRLQDTVSRIDQITTHTFTDEYYHHLNHQPLLQIDLDHDPVMQGYGRELYQVVRNPIGGLAMFTECGIAENSNCYYDLLFDIPNGTHLVGYNPKSRPWYLLARHYSDWVFFTFLATKESVPGYPKTPSLGFAKRIVRGAPSSDDDGIWVVVFSPIAAQSSSLLAMLFDGQKPPLDSLELSLPSYLLFSDALLRGDVSMPIQCAAITTAAGMHYQASVHCDVSAENLEYTFSKSYDHPFHLWALLIVATTILYGAYRFWKYVAELQLKQVEGELAVAVESKLVHDLRKGILTQLNKIFDDPTPDLGKHRHYLMLLNKYVGVLSNNLRRQKEDQWILFTAEMLDNYLRWILGEVQIANQVVEGEGPFLEIHYDTTVTLLRRGGWPHFSVPEMGFYRVLKNIIENYNTHGFGGLTLTVTDLGAALRLCARNVVPEQQGPSESTGLGVAIVSRLLEDNFGSQVRVHQNRTETTYELVIQFPKVTHD